MKLLQIHSYYQHFAAFCITKQNMDLMRANYYGSQNVAILSELNIFSLSKIYGQCENSYMWRKYMDSEKKRNAAVTIFFFFDEIKCFVSANKTCYSIFISILSFVKMFILLDLN